MVRKKIFWIDILRVYACTMVMLCHYCDAAYWSNSVAAPMNSLIKEVFKFVSMPSGNFWAIVFCILSGFVIGEKRISNTKDLIFELSNRYIRLMVPILIANLIVIIIQNYIGFNHYAYVEMFGNSTLSNYYYDKFEFTDALLSALSLSGTLIPPLWMLRALFMGNVLIIVYMYVRNKLRIGDCNLMIEIILIIAMLVIAYEYKTTMLYCLATFTGFVLYENRKIDGTLKSLIITILFIYLLYGLSIANNNYLDGFLNETIIRLVGSSNQLNYVFATMLVYAFSKNIRMNSIEYPKIRFNISSITYWIYLLHWPIICSFSVFIWLNTLEHLTLGFLVGIVLTLMLLLIISLLLSFITDKLLKILSIKKTVK